MRAKKGFKLRSFCDQNVVIPEGKENIDFSNIIYMNESSALLWNAIQGKDFTTSELAQILMDNYMLGDDQPLPEEQALNDAAHIVGLWEKAGIIEK